MSKLYSVYANAEMTGANDQPTRAVAHGFSWYGFLLSPVWALHKAGWQSFLIWLGAVFALGLLNVIAPFDGFLPYMMLALMFGFTAREFEARHLERLGYAHVGELLADSAIEAEVLAASSLDTQTVPPSES